MSTDHKQGDIVTATVTVRLPADASMKEVEDWLGYQFGARGGIDLTNPLVEYDVEATDVSI